VTSRPALELVTIGNELLVGETIDGNAAWLGRRCAEQGIRTARRATVGDDVAEIQAAVAQALDRTGVVICTGGLGPTRDDLTRRAVAGLFGREVRIDDALLDALRERYRRAGRTMAASNVTQAEVPEGATVLPNRLGSAPGLALEDGQRLVVLLPGVPLEMRALFDEQVLPLLDRRWPSRAGGIRHHVIRTTGIAESELGDRLEPILAGTTALDVAFLPSTIGVDVRLSSRGDLDEARMRAEFDTLEAAIRGEVGEFVFATGARDLVEAVAERLTRSGRTLALAESCTGGLVAKRLTDPPGASAFLRGGVVAYDNAVKVDALGVDPLAIGREGAVSETVALQMARGAARRLGADAAIAITGVAGPDGGSEEKPVGTVWIAVVTGEQERARLFRLFGDREGVRERAAQAALAMLWRMLD